MRSFEPPKLFPARDYTADALFGDIGSVSYGERFFLPFWGAVEEQFVREAENLRGRFLPGSLREFRKQFLLFSSTLWASLFTGVLYNDPVLSKIKDPGSYTRTAEQLILSGGLFSEVLRLYPVLEEKIRVLMNDTLLNLTEVCTLLTERDEEIRRFSFDGAAFSRIARISDGIADRHNRGRSVHIITYENGNMLVLKPHDMKIDRAFAGVTDDLCQWIGEPPLRHIRSREFGLWSCSEFIRREELSRAEDAGHFYFRVGILMAAVWLLGGNDIHSENLIACGDQPVLIDTETVFFAATPFDELFQPNDSDLSSAGFLPYLGPAPGLHPGCDSLTTALESTHNLPTFRGTDFKGSSFTREIIRGFSAVLSACIEHRAEVMTALRSRVGTPEVRRLLRPTKFYNTLLFVLSGKKALSSAEETRALKAMLYRHIRTAGREEAADRLADAEFEALLSLDIPEFRVKVREQDYLRIENRLNALSAERIRGFSEEIRFLLNPTHADDAGPIRTSSSVTGDLSEYGRRLRPALEGKPCLLTVRDGYRRYICKPIPTMLEGTLGAAVALAALSRILPEFTDGVKRFSEQILEKDSLWTPGISAREPGLSEGTGGFLFGVAILAEYGFLPPDFLDRVLQKTLSVCPAGTGGPDPSLFYGTDGLKIGLDRLRYARSLQGTPPRAVLPDIPARPDNYTLAFGLAGTLLRKTQQRIHEKRISPDSEEIELRDRLIRCGQPELVNGLTAPGLLFGESGRLYALAFHTDPTAVSVLFE